MAPPARYPTANLHSVHLAGFTLIELLVVIAILAVLSMIAVSNFQDAHDRALHARCTGNLRALGEALASYRLDHGAFPLADGLAGEMDSQDRTVYGDGPSGGGYWSAPPNALVRLGYLGRRETLFCPTLARRFSGPEAEHYRYAYNAASQGSGGFTGGRGRIDGVGATGEKIWLVRCLHINCLGIAPDRYAPFPHGSAPEPEKNRWGQENVLWNDFSVSLEEGASP